MADRETMNISLPRPLREWIDEQVEEGGFGTASEFVRHLIREARATARSAADIDRLLLEAHEAGRPQRMTPKDWEAIRKEGRVRLAASRRRRSA